MTIKEKEKLRAVKDHILISELGPIAFKNQAIVRPSIDCQYHMDHATYIWWLLHREVAIVGDQVVRSWSLYNESLECNIENVERWANEYVKDLSFETQWYGYEL